MSNAPTAEQREQVGSDGSRLPAATVGMFRDPSTWTGLWVLIALLVLVAVRKGFSRLGAL